MIIIKISAKTRYALASIITMAQRYSTKECTTLISLSEQLKISKIYLEQVFSLLKRGNIVKAIKGAQGGYLLARDPNNITAFEILSSIETALFEKTESTTQNSAPNIEQAMQEVLFDKLDFALKETLSKITLQILMQEAEKNNKPENYMYFL